MRYLITGGAGFIGSHVARKLAHRKQPVAVLDDFSTGKESNLANGHGTIQCLRGSVCDRDAVREASRGADCVIHLAARTSVPQSMKDPADTNDVNVCGTLNVFLAARDAGVRRVVFASSAAVYGDAPELPKSESMAPAPVSPYGISKLTGEMYGRVVGGVEVVSLRFFNVFGPRQDPASPYSGVLSRFIAALLRSEPPAIYGDGEQSRDFVYVDNVVDAILRATTAPDVAGMAFNVGSGQRYCLKDALRLLARFAQWDGSPVFLPARPGDIAHSQAEIRLARRCLGYEPRVSFAEGLRRTWEWYRAVSFGDGLDPASRRYGTTIPVTN